jgi:tRNA A-37 threonylcarbamoyl transferase component Bud32
MRLGDQGMIPELIRFDDGKRTIEIRFVGQSFSGMRGKWISGVRNRLGSEFTKLTGLVHGDLTSKNVCGDEEGVIYLIDFESAVAL